MTDEGDDKARRMICTDTYDESLPFLDGLFSFLDHEDGCDFGGRAWTSETFLTGIDYGDPNGRTYFGHLTLAMFPLLWRRLVDSNSSVGGHVWYSLTESGLSLARERVKTGVAQPYPPPPPDDCDEYDDAFHALALDYYYDIRKEAIHSMESAKPVQVNEIGPVPMPVSAPLRKFRQSKAT